MGGDESIVVQDLVGCQENLFFNKWGWEPQRDVGREGRHVR